MRDGLGRPQTILVLGGTSQIGCAIADRLLTGPGTVLLAGRDPDRLAGAAAGLARRGRRVETLHYDATAPAAATVDVLAAAGARVGDLDVVLLCVGVLTDEAVLGGDPVATETTLRTNLLGPVVAIRAAVSHLSAQGHGTLVVLSSVAAVRARPGLLTYGVAKSALDVYARRIGATARGSGARVLVVRPGHVRTRMTAGLAEPPFTTDAGQVAIRVGRALTRRPAVAYAPAILRSVMTVLRLLPPAIYRRVTDSGSSKDDRRIVAPSIPQKGEVR
jgi:decaprenylphospho-beta-D-erythro-pentofuranosid-2-ulose 2-reductase